MKRRFAVSISGLLLAVALVAACADHTAYYHCQQALADMRKFHPTDYLAVVGARAGSSDYCTIRNSDGHYHYAVVNIHDESILWR